MLSIYATAVLILLASLAIGRAVLLLLRWEGPAWLSGATGFAALVVLAPLLVRLPGRATTTALLIGALALASAFLLWRRGVRAEWASGGAVVVVVIALASLPFLVNERVGVLGEGIYTNDHAAQLYWADWLQNGFGPEPSAVRFGYPIGPQAVAVVAAQATGASLVTAFNGLLLAIPALTGLAALGALPQVPLGRRIAVAILTALPYLAASFLAQSAFKETAMALFVLAFAVALAGLERIGWRAVGAVGLLLAAAAVFTFSIPGLAWFALALPLWLLFEALAGHPPVSLRGARETLASNRLVLAIAAVVLIVGTVIAIGPAASFVEKINDVQQSPGRLSSPVFPGEAFGIWPQGDFRIVRGEVTGSLIATALGLLAAAYGAFTLVRRRESALLATLIAGGIVYLGARQFAQIHVEAKALAVIAPLTMLVSLRALLASGERDRPTLARYLFGALVLIAATASTLLALRAAPVGFDERQRELETLAEPIDGDSVAFLGVDRFAGYYLRGTLARAPAGYVPEEVDTRPEKVWQQGQPADFDSLDPGKLDKFDWAITTATEFASQPPANFEEVQRSGDYVLWRRAGETPRSRVLPGENGDPGQILDCSQQRERSGTATVLTRWRRAPSSDWNLPPLVDNVAGGQERAFAAPGEATIEIPVAQSGEYGLSLQYHSQVALEVSVGGEPVAELPPSLEGMYLDGAGRGAFWPAGEVDHADPGSIELTVKAAEPSGLQELLGVDRRVWLGDAAAISRRPAIEVPLAKACGLYVDHFRFDKRGRG